MSLAHIATYVTSLEAHLAKGYLHEHGIPADVWDEHIVDVDPFATEAYGGVKLAVPASLASAAKALLDEQQALRLREEGSASAEWASAWPKLAVYFGSIFCLMGVLFLLLSSATSVYGWVLSVAGGGAWFAGWSAKRRPSTPHA